MSTVPNRMNAKSFRVQTAARIAGFRKSKQFSKNQMARFMGVHIATYRDIEDGVRDVKAFEIYSLSKSTGVEVDYFFPWDMLGK